MKRKYGLFEVTPDMVELGEKIAAFIREMIRCHGLERIVAADQQVILEQARVIYAQAYGNIKSHLYTDTFNFIDLCKADEAVVAVKSLLEANKALFADADQLQALLVKIQDILRRTILARRPYAAKGMPVVFPPPSASAR